MRHGRGRYVLFSAIYFILVMGNGAVAFGLKKRELLSQFSFSYLLPSR